MIISIFNQKGGVAKSTTVISLAASLATLGKKILVVDMDPQANSTVGLGQDDEELEKTIYDLLRDQKVTREKVEGMIIETRYDNLSLLPSDIQLSNADIALVNYISRENLLSRILNFVRNDYDYILIDCPPSLGLLSLNSLVASNRIIVPITPGFFSTKGIKHLLNTVELIHEQNLNSDLEVMGVLLTKYDARKNISKDLEFNLRKAFDDRVFKTVIRTDAQVEYAQENMMPIIFYNEKAKATEDYLHLAEEVIENEKRQ